MKKCSRCDELKSFNDFSNGKNICKECRSICNREYRKAHPGIDKKYYHSKKKQKWLEKNKEKTKEYCRAYRRENAKNINTRVRQWYADNIEVQRERMKRKKMTNPGIYQTIQKHYREKKKNDVMYRINHSVRSGIRLSLKGNKENQHWENLVGYTLIELKKHLENLFTKGMSWINYGEWHVDHIIPISLWEFKIPKDREFKQCWALANLQPLWASENFSKGNRI